MMYIFRTHVFVHRLT